MAANNVWTQMGYVPPRGHCNFKPSIVSTKCPCLRFMLHPLKSSSSYECDGCGHHASFHSMENKAEDDVRKRWEQEAREKQNQEDSSSEHSRKRLRQISFGERSTTAANGRKAQDVASGPDEIEGFQFRSASGAGPSKARGKTKQGNTRTIGARGAATRARGKVTEILDDEDEVLSVD